MNGFDPCVFLLERWKNLAMWRNLWTILLFLLGLTFAGFLIAAICLFINKSWIATALTTFGTIVNGVGTAWILARRTQAVTEEEEAKKELLAHCGGGGGGTGGAATVSSLAAGGVQTAAPCNDAVKAVEKKLGLFFGMIR